MNGFRVLFLLLSVINMSGGVEFTSKYGGALVKGIVGSSFKFEWGFSGDVRLISWGLAPPPSSFVLQPALYELVPNGNPGSASTLAAYVGRVDGTSNKSFVIFTLHNLKLEDTNQYGCLINARTPGVREFDVMKLVVESPPNITEISANQTVNEGKDLTLNCSASGNPAPNATWTKLSDKSLVTMPLTNIKRTDEGGYRCSAYNGIGKPATKDAFITVYYQPSITSVTALTKQSWIGQQVRLRCAAEGSPTPSITWKRPNGSELRKVTSTENTVYAQMKGDQDFGNYTCEASNIVGAALHSVQLNQIKPPESPSLTTNDSDIRASSLTIKWTAPADDGGSPITGYNLVILRGGSVIRNETTSAAIRAYLVDRLNKSTTYTLKISAMNRVFQGATSEMKVTTKYEGAPATVEIVSLPSETRNISVTIKWNEPENNGAPIRQYTVYQRMVNTDKTVGEWNKVREVQGLSKRQVVLELELGKVYEFVVTATNKHGDSLREGKNVRKLVVLGVRPEPVVFVTSVGKDGKVTLTWEKPEENGAVINHYVIYKRIANDEEWMKVVNVTVFSPQGYVVQLEKGKKYDLVVTAINKYGESSINKENIKTVDVPSEGIADSDVQKEPKRVSPAIIAGAAAVGVLLILGLIILVIWRKRRKTPSETGSGTVGLHGPYPDELEHGYSAVGVPSTAQQLQAGGPVPDVTYAQVNKSKKKSKAPVTDVYAQVDKSKKSEKKRNKQPGELEYAELDDFKPATQPQASGATARPLIRAPVYEGTEYADITQFGVPQSEPTYDNVPRKKDVVYSNVESM